MSEHHFVVKFDTDTRTWSWDTETESAVFNDGTIYLDGDWVHSGDVMEKYPNVYDLDEVCSTVLSSALELMNQSLSRHNVIPQLEKKIVTEMDGVS